MRFIGHGSKGTPFAPNDAVVMPLLDSFCVLRVPLGRLAISREVANDPKRSLEGLDYPTSFTLLYGATLDRNSLWTKKLVINRPLSFLMHPPLFQH